MKISITNVYMDIYYNKYLKYKKKYILLKMINQTGGVKNNFYIIHSVFKFDNIFDILKTGIIDIGKNLPSDALNMSSPEYPLSHIFSNIYFDDIKNLSYFWQASIVLHPKIISDYGCIFHKGWSCDATYPSDIIIKKKDLEINKKLSKIKKYIKNPPIIPNVHTTPYTNHEILFDHSIPIKKYGLMITCNFCNDKDFNKIKRLVKKYGYHVKLLRGNVPMPTLNDLI